ncbi:MAG: hypothetical protein HUU56_08945 [Bdellovibrionaceae bacterium]|nr:hypothetical protein [Pseudobdellovibrionaceae bacterium]
MSGNNFQELVKVNFDQLFLFLDSQEFFYRFETCLRKIYFFDSAKLSESQSSSIQKYCAHPFLQILAGEGAYSLILQIISGLKSDVKGETEIFGQYKKFHEDYKSQLSIKRRSCYLPKHLEQLSSDCKFLRDKHIQKWGSQSYGSLSRKLLDKERPVLLLGSGQLAKEIAPWLSQINEKFLVIRQIPKTNEEFQEFRQIQEHQLADVSCYGNYEAEISKEMNLIIAAPVSNDYLEEKFLKKIKVNKIIDWRGEARLFQNAKNNYFHLDEVKQMLLESEQSLQHKISLVKEEIDLILQKHRNKMTLFPWGWDDICA